MQHNVIKTVSVLLLAGFIYPACADNWYQVEVIVFAHLKSDADGEVWRQDPGRAGYRNVVELSGRDKTAMPDATVAAATEVAERQVEDNLIENEPIAFLPSHPENFRLQGIYRVLRLSADYRPLQHISWQQPALGDRAARAVHLSLYRRLKHPLPSKRLEIPITDEPEVLGEPIFDGFVRLRSTRLLHVNVDMNYFPGMLDGHQNDDLETGPASERRADHVRLKESRKIKLNEIHYFDHPLFGVIVQVSRLQTEDERQGTGDE